MPPSGDLRFTDVRVDHLIFTKLDEAAHIGVLLNVIRKVNKIASYITTGPGSAGGYRSRARRRLAQLILGEYDGGASRLDG